MDGTNHIQHSRLAGRLRDAERERCRQGMENCLDQAARTENPDLAAMMLNRAIDYENRMRVL